MPTRGFMAARCHRLVAAFGLLLAMAGIARTQPDVAPSTQPSATPPSPTQTQPTELSDADAAVLAALADPSPDVRDAAMFELQARGVEAIPTIRRLIARQPMPEVRRRLRYAATMIYDQSQRPDTFDPRLQFGRQATSGAFVGVNMQRTEALPIEPEIAELGVVIAAPIPFLPADRAGLRSGDIVVAVNGERLPTGPAAINRFMQVIGYESDVGDPLEMLVVRGDGLATVTVETCRRPQLHPYFTRLTPTESPDMATLRAFEAWYQANIDAGASLNDMIPPAIAPSVPAAPREEIAIRRGTGGNLDMDRMRQIIEEALEDANRETPAADE